MATTTVQVTAFEHEIAFAQAEINQDRRRRAREHGAERRAGGAAEAGRMRLSQTPRATLERERARAAETIAADKIALADGGGERAAERRRS